MAVNKYERRRIKLQHVLTNKEPMDDVERRRGETINKEYLQDSETTRKSLWLCLGYLGKQSLQNAARVVEVVIAQIAFLESHQAMGRMGTRFLCTMQNRGQDSIPLVFQMSFQQASLVRGPQQNGEFFQKHRDFKLQDCGHHEQN